MHVSTDVDTNEVEIVHFLCIPDQYIYAMIP